MKSLADRMREAARVLEEASALYGYSHPQWANWCASDLNREADHVENSSPGLYEVKP